MRESFQSGEAPPGRAGGAPAAPVATGDTEEIDALPVLAPEATVVHPYPLPGAPATYWRSTSAAIPAVQAAAAAAGGFVAGAAVIRLVSRRHRNASQLLAPRRGRRGRGRDKRPGSKAGELVQIVGSRSLLVDVHLLGGRD